MWVVTYHIYSPFIDLFLSHVMNWPSSSDFGFVFTDLITSTFTACQTIYTNFIFSTFEYLLLKPMYTHTFTFRWTERETWYYKKMQKILL